MRRLFATLAASLVACAAADAGDGVANAAPRPMAAGLGGVACVPSADETVWLPAPGEAVALGARDGAYGKSCDGNRDERWVAELVNVHGAAFRVQAATGDRSDAAVELTVYGLVTPHWAQRTYVPGHWESLAASRGPAVAWAAVDPADDVAPYTIVRVAARAGGAATLPVAITVSR